MSASRAMRLGNPQRTMLNGTLGVFGLLLLFQIARGWPEGEIRPVILSAQARAVGRHQQGAVVGLRQTGQRLASPDPARYGGDCRPLRHQPKILVYAAFMLPLGGLLALISSRLQPPVSGDT